MLWLTRVRLRRDAAAGALAPLLLGASGRGGTTRQPGHHLVWSLFADSAERRRDFLWRQQDAGVFLTLSRRPPEDHHDLFVIDEPKPFAPALEPNDRLLFSLRANPVVRRRDPARNRSVKHDVVMDALRSHPSGQRADRRLALVREQGLAWLERQGERAGFRIGRDEVRVDGYDRHRISRKSASPMVFSTLDLDGLLTVSEPDDFVAALARGFGAAKAYGCGLMLIRRAPRL